MARVLLLGASGLVGRDALRLALAHGAVDRVIAPTRMPLPLQERLDNPVASDLESFLPHVARWSADRVICTLGTTMAKAGSQKSFYRVDHDLPVAFARAAQQYGAQAFALVSAIGASPSSRFFYPRIKGETEADIRRVGFASLTILRPMIIEGAREESRLAEGIVLGLAMALGPMLPRRFRANPASTIARVALEAVVNPTPGVRVVATQELTART
jgi:uncharacterized protein YbjT (DUF2867 family)